MGQGIVITIQGDVGQALQAVSGLQGKFEQFFTTLQSRMRVASELREAMSRLGELFAAGLGVEALREFAREALAAGRSQAQLEAALRSTGQASTAFRNELLEQREALSRSTGIEADEI